MKRLIRGSVAGLVRHHQEQKEKNTSEMLKVIARLQVEKALLSWTYKEVWCGAGLKSGVALTSEWNSHVRLAIDAHNAHVKNLRDSNDAPAGSHLAPVCRIKQLRSLVKDLERQRNEALSKLAVYEAEIEFYKSRYDEVVRLNVRLQDSIKRNMRT